MSFDEATLSWSLVRARCTVAGEMEYEMDRAQEGCSCVTSHDTVEGL